MYCNQFRSTTLHIPATLSEKNMLMLSTSSLKGLSFEIDFENVDKIDRSWP
jgi:hypothetical protein